MIPKIHVEPTCNKQTKSFTRPNAGLSNKDISKNFSRTFMPKKYRRAVLPPVLMWQASPLGGNSVFGRLLIMWHKLHLDPVAPVPVPGLVPMLPRSSCAQSPISTDRHPFVRQDIDYAIKKVEREHLTSGWREWWGRNMEKGETKGKHRD